MKKCSFENHKEINAISYCQECKIYMCNECENHHSKLFTNHHQFKLENEENIKEIFTGLCKEENHNEELIFYCKSHNTLCCAKCITTIKDKKIGQHSKCDICYIEEFEKEKKDKLSENIKCLEDLLITLDKSIIHLKKTLEKINQNREETKINIQKIFSKIRNALNEREDELLSIIDNKKYYYLNEGEIKKIEKLPNKSKDLLEKVKLINYDWKYNKLNSLINDCINLENNIIEVNIINDLSKSIKNSEPKKLEIKFIIEDIYEDDINRFKVAAVKKNKNDKKKL